MHPNSQMLFAEHALPLFRRGMKVLEIGPDAFPSTYRRATKEEEIEWHTLDLHDNPRLTYPRSDPYRFGIPDEAYDVVLSGQVIEHVRKPWKWMPEVARVTKTGGRVVTINPVSWSYHEDPIDCWRAYPEGMKALYEEAGLEVELSRWGSEESPGYRRYVPGISLVCQPPFLRRAYKILGLLGLPVERSYDTITVGRKIARGEAGAMGGEEGLSR